MSVAEQAKRVYESHLKTELEAKHRDRFVAIEPVSESFFLGDEFIDAAMAAKNAYPDRKSSAANSELKGTSVMAWIDTAFDGHLVFPLPLSQELKLQSLVDTEAILADGRKVTLETFVCYLDWFGKLIPLQVIANDGKLPLLGTGLLENHVLHVDYVNKELTID